MKSKLINKRKEEKLSKQCLKWFHCEYDNEGKGFGRIAIKKAHNHYGYTSIYVYYSRLPEIQVDNPLRRRPSINPVKVI